MDLPLTLITAFAVKHFICDFPLQRKFQYENKGIYGHPGGLIHSGCHAVGTLFVLSIFAPLTLSGWTIASLMLFDAVTHYHIDWLKVNVCEFFGLKADNSEWFWHILGVDQLLHFLTYVAIVVLVIK